MVAKIEDGGDQIPNVIFFFFGGRGRALPVDKAAICKKQRQRRLSFEFYFRFFGFWGRALPAGILRLSTFGEATE